MINRVSIPSFHLQADFGTHKMSKRTDFGEKLILKQYFVDMFF